MELLQGESLIWRGRPSWRSIVSFYATWVVVAVVLLVIIQFFDWGIAAGVFVVVIAVAVVIGWLRRRFTEYTITTKRITIRRGVLSKTEQSAHIERLQNVTIRQSVFDRIFRVGTLDFDTAGGDRDAELRFDGIDNPRRLRDRIASEFVGTGGPAASPEQPLAARTDV